MASLRRRRCSLWLLITLGAGLVALGLSSVLPALRAELVYVAPVLVFLSAFAYFIWVEFLQQLTMNGECPACHRRGMRRIARSTSYFECLFCRVRLKRSSPHSEWEDASAAEADELYRRNSQGGLWGGYAKPDPGKTTAGQLLLNKRSRGLSPAVDEDAGSGSIGDPEVRPIVSGQPELDSWG